jgi:hypothetical protein
MLNLPGTLMRIPRAAGESPHIRLWSDTTYGGNYIDENYDGVIYLLIQSLPERAVLVLSSKGTLGWTWRGGHFESI